MTTRLVWQDLAIEIPQEIADQPPEAVLAYEMTALDAACRAAHGMSLESYRKQSPAAPAKE